MSDNKLVKTLTDAAGITGLAAGIGFLAKKVIAASLATKDYLEKQKILPS